MRKSASTFWMMAGRRFGRTGTSLANASSARACVASSPGSPGRYALNTCRHSAQLEVSIRKKNREESDGKVG